MTALQAARDKQVACGLCGAEVTTARPERRHLGDSTFTFVVATPGTAFAHIRDKHPEWWATMCRVTRNLNRYRMLPRRVDGALLRRGEDVGALGET